MNPNMEQLRSPDFHQRFVGVRRLGAWVNVRQTTA